MIRTLSTFAIIIFFAAQVFGQIVTPPAPNLGKTRPQVQVDYGKLPLSFESNQGQTDPQVRFTSRGNGYSLFLTDSAAVLSLSRPNVPIKKYYAIGSREKTPSDVVRMELVGANRNLHVTGTDQLPGKANYFIGNDPSKWHSDVPTYAKVRYTSVYPGVDLVYYGNQRQLEYDLVVAPEVSPASIKLHFAGAKRLHLTASGDLIITAEHGEIAFHKPMIYQTIDARHESVNGRFTLSADNTVGFTLGRYDHTRPVIIDPVLSYSTYFNYIVNGIPAVAVDAAGNAYITGNTGSTNFPATPGALVTIRPFSDQSAFVAKLNSSGTQLLYATYLGGNGGGSDYDQANAIAVDSAGDAYVVGLTRSEDFPVTSTAEQVTDTNTYGSGFISKLNPEGNSLVYSSFLSGSRNDGPDQINAVALDPAGNAYVTGITQSANFPVTPGAFQNTYKQYGNITSFVTKFSSSGSTLLYSSYLGGSTLDQANSIAVDSNGNAYVAGSTLSSDFPATPNAFQTSRRGSEAAFVAKVDPSGGALVYATYLSGSNQEQGTGIAADSSGNAYVTGIADSADLPVTADAYQTHKKSSDTAAFIAEVNASGQALSYCTYLSGSTHDQANAIAVDGSGTIYVTGIAESSDFPTTTGAYQTTTRTGNQGTVFLTSLKPIGNTLTYSTFLGGSEYEYGSSIALDTSGNPYVVGYTTSSDFPISSSALQTTNLGNAGFILKLSLGTGSATATATPIFSPGTGAYSSAQTVTISDATSGSTIYYTTNGSIPTTSSTTYTAPITVSASETIEAIAVASGYANSAVGSATFTINGSTSTVATPTFSPVEGTYTSAQTVTINDSTSGATIYYTTDGTVPTASSTQYTTPVTISSTETLSAIAVASGYQPSAVETGLYTITAATPDFALVLSSSALTVSSGNSGTDTLTFTTQGGFSQAVTLSCSGLPTGASCSFSPATFTPSASSTTDTLTVAVAANSGRNEGPAPLWPAGGGIAIALCCIVRLRRSKSYRMLLVLVGAFALCTAVIGCGGSSGSSGSGGSTTSIVTVNAVSGTLQHSTTFSLTTP